MNQYPKCQEHQDSDLEFLKIGEESVKLCCSQCIYRLQNELLEVNFKDILHLKIMQNEPEELAYRSLPKHTSIMFDEFTKVNNFIKLLEKSLTRITNLKQILDQLDEKTSKWLTETQNIQQEMRSKLANALQLNKFIQDYSSLSPNLEENKKISIEEVESSLLQHITELRENCHVISSAVCSQLSSSSNNNKSMLHSYFSLQQAYQKAFCNLTKILQTQHQDIQQSISLLTNCSTLVDSKYLLHLIKIVEKKQQRLISTININFQNSDSNLNFGGLINTIQGRSRQIMIFKTKCGSVFGAYIPQIIEKTQWSYSQFSDDSLVSFLFSYTLQEIYPLKEEGKQHAFYISSECLAFGGTSNKDCDIKIDTNFINGYSQLGVAYEAKGKDSTKRSNYLFCGYKPEIIECEVFELLLN